MTKSKKINEKRLSMLEGEFQAALTSCLKECAAGRWGLFGHNEHLDPEHRYWKWSEAQGLTQMATEIQELRAAFGQPNPLCARFLHYRSLGGANVPGEPKLAQAFLDELAGLAIS
jgi:hypothetical protein